MKRTAGKRLALIAAAALVLGTLAGCGPTGSANNVQQGPAGSANNVNNANAAQPGGNSGSNSSGNTVSPGGQGGNSSANTADPGGQGNIQTPEVPAAVTVSSIEELIEAVKPGASIVIKPGEYNIGEALQAIAKGDVNAFNSSHKYVQIGVCFDGLELVFFDADGLAISGGSRIAADTRLLTSPRQAGVLNFSLCDNITLKNFTAGHTDGGECRGDVILLENSKDAKLENLDLFGCGVYAVNIAGDSSGLTVSWSILRDCSEGAICVADEAVGGRILFENCTLTGSHWGGYFPLSLGTVMSFKNCRFGLHETEYFMFLDHARTEDCEFSEIEVYPEFGPFSPLFMPSEYQETSVSAQELAEAEMWFAYVVHAASADPASDDFTYTPYTDPKTGEASRLAFSFSADGSGSIREFGAAPVAFTWSYGAGTSIIYKTEDGRGGLIEPYIFRDEYDPELSQKWLKIPCGDLTAWVCLVSQ